MYCCAHKTATLTSIQKTVCGRNCLNLVFKSQLLTPNTTDVQAQGWLGYLVFNKLSY